MLGKRLDDVAKILAGALVAVAGIMTTLGLNSKFVFVALNNRSWPIYVASLCASLSIAVVGAAQAAGGNGRPTITDVTPDGPRSAMRLALRCAGRRRPEGKCEAETQRGPACTELHIS
ncbi:hypothetical protein [Streptomyces albireticuli]|uniref:Uncharacterized protein n=1 Tax=Streptomyces albireticuli TaxID=1940 RepID=A0A2A2DA54_9ACTN|nr:hypothetical protein [Streptomyces albireticuli]MCD9195231.1 hypothetical protein [Streptomyces albireticuli]PAU48361.1 hypothetical protein CK936_13700 [Streptomyces albireticuli]